MTIAQAQHNFKHFNKYDFVKSFMATASDPKIKEEKEKEAVLIADAFEETQKVLFEHLATKQDLVLLKSELKQDLVLLKSELKQDIKNLEYQLTIKLTAIIVTAMTFLPLITEFLKKLF